MWGCWGVGKKPERQKGKTGAEDGEAVVVKPLIAALIVCFHSKQRWQQDCSAEGLGLDEQGKARIC